MHILDGAEAMANEQEIEWFWDKRIPKKAITVLAAAGGEGKSALALWLGLKLGCRRAKHVMYVDAEQTFVHLTSRLRQWATPNEARRLYIPVEQSSKSSLIESATPPIKEIARQTFERGCELVIIDSLTTISADLDIGKRGPAAQLMTQLKIIAAEGNAAVLLIAHINKRFDKDKEIDVDDVCGNKAVSDLSRSVFLMTSEKDDPTSKNLIHVKNNWAPRQPIVKFTLTDVIEDFREDEPILAVDASQADLNEMALQLAQDGQGKDAIRNELKKVCKHEMMVTRAVYYVGNFGYRL
jgi:predicted ATP-dependent serine protease